jgi:hypothetical protein
MNELSFGELVVGIISLIMIITFFVIAARLKNIYFILDFFYKLESGKPENQKLIKCEKCGKEFHISIAKKGVMNCPHCRQVIRLT